MLFKVPFWSILFNLVLKSMKEKCATGTNLDSATSKKASLI